jgi:accessory Sec system S-layer assembly protein
MFKLLDRFKKETKKIQGKESHVSSGDLLNQESVDTSSQEMVRTTLSIHPDSKLTQEDQYYFQFLNNDLPDLKVNQLSIAGIELKKDQEALYVMAFVRNSLPKAIKLGQTPLLLIGPGGENIASKEFDLSLLGDIPAKSSRPWQFVFPLKEVKQSEIPLTGWKLAFELKAPHKLDLDKSWEQSMAGEEISKLEKLVSTLQAPKPGEVNFMGLKAAIDNGSLHITMLIRNGSKKDIHLQQLPLVVEDASGNMIAQGGFQLEDFKVKANTSKPWTFIFPETLLKNKAPDLSKWKAYPLTK